MELLKDLAVNMVGFIPLGFFFYAYFSQLRKAEHSAAITIALGFAVSLTIEVLQAVPSDQRLRHDRPHNEHTRDSGRSNGVPKQDGSDCAGRGGVLCREFGGWRSGESADPLVSFALHSPMDPTMAVSAQGDQVVRPILAGVTPIFLMVHFEIAHRTAGLTSPAVAPKHLLPQFFIVPRR